MTAAWCITCLANEQTTLGTERVKAVMADQGITYMKGDWTNEDPEITAVLERFNRPSVPLYVLYPGQKTESPSSSLKFSHRNSRRGLRIDLA